MSKNKHQLLNLVWILVKNQFNLRLKVKAAWTSKTWIEAEMKTMVEVATDAEHTTSKTQLWKSLTKNLITKELPEKLIKTQCITKFVVKSFHNSYIWDLTSWPKTTKNWRITALLMCWTVQLATVLTTTFKKE